MFNPERLLGSLVTTALSQGIRGQLHQQGRRSGLTSLAGNVIRQNRGAIGMGLLGLAIGAFEHFSQKSQSPPPSNVPSSPFAPMPQSPTAGPSVSSVPWTPPPLPHQAGKPDLANREGEAILLIRAMIASANADHNIDEQERQKIVAKMAESGLSTDDRGFLENELANPLELRSLIEQINTPELAEQVYVASLLAVDLDSDAERNYLRRLAKGLNLDEAVVSKWSKAGAD